MASEYLPTKCLSITKGNRVTLQCRELTDNHLDQVIQANTTCPRGRALRRAQHPFCGVPAWKARPESGNADGCCLKHCRKGWQRLRTVLHRRLKREDRCITRTYAHTDANGRADVTTGEPLGNLNLGDRGVRVPSQISSKLFQIISK